MEQHRKNTGLFLFALALPTILLIVSADPPGSMTLDQPATVTPTPDRLATPVMPESPSQVDIGRNLYYYHCMPCHGDRGQGLTDEWRQVWVEDHENCWAAGCHAGRAGDEGFPIPRYVPPISGSPQAMAASQTADDLCGYLVQYHPPQRPGALAEDEYWALTAFLMYENDRLPSDGRVGPGNPARSQPLAGVTAAIAVGLSMIVLFALTARQRSKAVDVFSS